MHTIKQALTSKVAYSAEFAGLDKGRDSKQESDDAMAEVTAQSVSTILPQTAPDQVHSVCVTAEIAGPKGPEPTRFGDWERNGRCIDF